MFKQKYIITVELEQFPEFVDLSWLAKRFCMSRQTIASKIEMFNVGGKHKKLYDPKIVIPILKIDLTRRRPGRPRKN